MQVSDLKNTYICLLLQCLENWKFIDLSDSKQLMKIPKLSSMPNLVKLNLGGCRSFYQFHSSVDAFPKMEFLRCLILVGVESKNSQALLGP